MKKGFSLIELVLAIVIVSIAILALPTIVIQSQRSNEMALQQELTLQAKAMIGRVLSSSWDSNHWDQKRRNDPSCNGIDTNRFIINSFDGISGRCETNDIYTPIYAIDLNGTVNRPGSGILTSGNSNIYKDSVRKKPESSKPESNFASSKDTTKSTAYGLNPGKNDMNEYNGNSGNFNKGVNPGEGDFLSELRMITTVNYIDVQALPGTGGNVANLGSVDKVGAPTNVKKIEVTATNINSASEFGNYRVTLKYYAPNIGDAQIARADWNR